MVLFWCLQVLPRPALLLSFEKVFAKRLIQALLSVLFCLAAGPRLLCLRFLRHHLYLLSNCALLKSLNSVYLRFIPIAKTAYRLGISFFGPDE